MADALNVALIQMNSGAEVSANLKTAEAMIRQAAGQGAKFICTPENTCHILSPQDRKLASCSDEQNHPALPLFAELAKELGVWILVGSLGIKVSPDKIANRSYLFGVNGDIVAKYNKIHLFDVDLPTGESHRESKVVQAGDKAVIAPTLFGGVGMSICYDLRFAALYRFLAQNGASILTVPAAFTVPTGQAHWEVLLRARAIETGSFVLAPAQCGTHDGGRKTYGHSMIIDPWGVVLAEGGDEVGIISVTLDLSAVSRARNAIPALQHDRGFS